MSEKSPCIKVCQLHTAYGLDYCVGCYRTIQEIAYWHEYTDKVKEYIITQCYNRRNRLHHGMGFNEDYRDEEQI